MSTPAVPIPPQTPASSSRASGSTDTQKTTEILGLMTSRRLPLPSFLATLLDFAGEGQGSNNSISNTLRAFLSGQTNISVSDILDKIYHHKFSSPAKVRPGGSNSGSTAGLQKDGKAMARHQMEQWALKTVVRMCVREIEVLTEAKDNPLTRLRKKNLTWALLNGLKMSDLKDHVEKVAPTIWTIVRALAVREKTTHGKEWAPRGDRDPSQVCSSLQTPSGQILFLGLYLYFPNYLYALDRSCCRPYAGFC